MRPDPIEIVFGDQKFTIRPLTLGQVRDIEKALTTPDQTSSDLAIRVIAAALRRDHASVDVEDLEGGPVEIGAALNAVLELGGFKKAESGEAVGEPAPVATGA